MGSLIGFIDYVENWGGLTNATVTLLYKALISKISKLFSKAKGFKATIKPCHTKNVRVRALLKHLD